MNLLPLSDGNKIPELGLGVWKARKGNCHKAVLSALEAGYRHFDTAAIYGNEDEVGQAIIDFGIDRKEVFITTKLWNSSQGFNSALIAIEKSLENLKTNYVDLYLIHYPVTGKRIDSWKALQKIKELGKARSIGVSNYTIKHLDEMKSLGLPMPSVNQVEYHPWLNQTELKQYCEENKIALEAYSPLGHGEVLNEDALIEVAQKLGKSPAQILIRWSLQKGNIVIPKSVNASRIRENFSVKDFTIPDEIMQTMETWNKNMRTCWDPSDTP